MDISMVVTPVKVKMRRLTSMCNIKTTLTRYIIVSQITAGRKGTKLYTQANILRKKADFKFMLYSLVIFFC